MEGGRDFFDDDVVGTEFEMRPCVEFLLESVAEFLGCGAAIVRDDGFFEALADDGAEVVPFHEGQITLKFLVIEPGIHSPGCSMKTQLASSVG